MPQLLRDDFLPFSRPKLGEEEKRAVLAVLDSGWLTTGQRAREFEEMFRSYIGARYAIAVNSCTAALHLSLLALNVGPGDEVITTPFTFAATGNTIVHCGALPVFVDIDPLTFNLAPDGLEKKISSRTKAIVAVHFAGQACEMERITALAAKHKIALVEDAAHAVGTEYKRIKAGRFGQTGCFSFYPTKTITTGEGGMITTDDDALAKRCRQLALHGISLSAWQRYSDKGQWFYQIDEAGFKYNLSDVQAAIGIQQLKKVESFIAAREKYARLYDDGLHDVDYVQVQRVQPHHRHSRHLYPVLIDASKGPERDVFIEKMKTRKIGTSVHFIPLHLHPLYQRSFGYRDGDFPVAERIYRAIVSLPLYPSMTEQDVGYVIDSIQAIARGGC